MMGGMLRAALESSLSAAVMILAVLALRLRFRDRTPGRAFCLLWDIVLVRLLAPGALPSPVSIRRWLPVLHTRLEANAAASLPATVSYVSGAELEEVWQVQTAYLTEGKLQLVPVENTAVPQAVAWDAVAAAVWLGIALLLAAGFLWSHLRSRKVYASSLPVRDGFVSDWLAEHPLYRPVQARTSDRIDAPLTYGLLYPVVLLPRGMDWEDRTALACVLAHEREHIRRFDALRKPLLAAALCLHWFNPLVWAMYVLANRDIELACDEAVLRDGADREAYALALLSMEERRGRWRPTGSHFSGHALEERIRAIMKRKQFSMTALVALLVVMSITTTVFASAAPEKEARRDIPAVTRVESEEEDAVIFMSGEAVEPDSEWHVEWWTYEDYKAWLEQEEENLQSIIGERAWTPSTGWFTWDQARVDEAKARYEATLESIKNGALYSMRIIDRDGNAVEDVTLGYDSLSIASIREKPAEEEVAVREIWEALEINGDETSPRAAFEDIFARYEEFGLVYRPREGGMGVLTYNGLPVRSFADLKPGGAFSYEDPCAEDGLKLYVEYGEDGQPVGLLSSPAPMKDVDPEKRELGFDTRAPVQGAITAGFGQGSLRFHYGVDISAEKGSDVAAFAAGTVRETGFSADIGNYVVLTHPEGYSTLYAHCLGIAVAEGDSVALGQKIAEVGASGMATGPALHFELRSGDAYLDPGVYLE